MQSPFDSFNLEQSKPFAVIGKKKTNKDKISPFKISTGSGECSLYCVLLDLGSLNKQKLKVIA